MDLERTDVAQAHFDRTTNEYNVIMSRQQYALALDRAHGDGYRLCESHQLAHVPAERQVVNGYSNGQTAFDKGSEWGYARGEGERIALATANSELRSALRIILTMVLEHEPYGDISMFVRDAAGT